MSRKFDAALRIYKEKNITLSYGQICFDVWETCSLRYARLPVDDAEHVWMHVDRAHQARLLAMYPTRFPPKPVHYSQQAIES